MAHRQKHAVKIVVDLPQAFQKPGVKSFELNLSPKDFSQSWIECIAKNVKNDKLIKALQASRPVYTITDKRLPGVRKIWKLSANIGSFIDSFERTMQKYTAHIGTLQPNTPSPAKNPPQSQSNSQNTANQSPATKRVSFNPQLAQGRQERPGPSKTVLTSSMKRKSNNDTSSNQNQAPAKNPRIVENGIEEKVLHFSGRIQNAVNQSPGMKTRNNNLLSPNQRPPVRVNLPPIPPPGDDNASMAESMFSQDSQEDLEDDGIDIREIKEAIIQKIRLKVDNNTMLRVQHELQKLMNDGKFFRAAKYLPMTCNVLQIIFNLSSS